MSFTTVQFGKYVSIVVLLLMFVAVAAGQADADAETDLSVQSVVEPDHFRSEDE